MARAEAERLLAAEAGDRGGRSAFSEPKGGLTSLTTWYGKDGVSGPGFEGPAPANDHEPPRSAAPDERTTKDQGDRPVMDRRTERDENSLATPKTEEQTGTRRTDPPKSSAANETGAKSDAGGGKMLGAPSDAPNTPKKG